MSDHFASDDPTTFDPAAAPETIVLKVDHMRLELAWRDGIARVHVHTCSLDHPAALAAYRRAGFTAIGRAIETFPDPRLSGLLPRNCAPQIPLTGSAPASCV